MTKKLSVSEKELNKMMFKARKKRAEIDKIIAKYKNNTRFNAIAYDDFDLFLFKWNKNDLINVLKSNRLFWHERLTRYRYVVSMPGLLPDAVAWLKQLNKNGLIALDDFASIRIDGSSKVRFAKAKDAVEFKLSFG